MPKTNTNNVAVEKKAILFFFFLILFLKSFSQSNTHTDSLVNALLNSTTLTGNNQEGLNLIKENKFEQANSVFSTEISKDAGNKEAYFNRGVTNWAMSNPANACRDWSSVLALGDTVAFKLLDKNCHGEMVVEDDTIPQKIYRKLFAASKKNAKTLSADLDAINVADEMPSFTGGPEGLYFYLKTNLKYPASAKEKEVQGTVYVNFIISKKGKVLYPYIVRGIGGGCDEEALRVVRAMPGWIPGKLKGKPVLVRYNLPVRFVSK